MVKVTLRTKDLEDKRTSTMRCSFSARTLCCWLQEVLFILTGPINPRRPVRVKGRSETGTPSAVTGTVCQNREEDVRQQTTH